MSPKRKQLKVLFISVKKKRRSEVPATGHDSAEYFARKIRVTFMIINPDKWATQYSSEN